jgi:hypothetical protein
MSAEAGWHRPVPRNPRIAPPPPASQARSPAGRRNLIASRAILKAERRAPKQPAAPAFKTARDVPTMGCQPCLARWTRLAAAPVRDPDVSPRRGRPCLLNLPAHNGPLACFPLFFRWLAAVPVYRSPKAPFPRRGRRAVDSLVHQVVSYLK